MGNRGADTPKGSQRILVNLVLWNAFYYWKLRLIWNAFLKDPQKVHWTFKIKWNKNRRKSIKLETARVHLDNTKHDTTVMHKDTTTADIQTQHLKNKKCKGNYKGLPQIWLKMKCFDSTNLTSTIHSLRVRKDQLQFLCQ